jgi:hypothetical protein|nr:MAG TPA: hypothetical protein [Caudoviricetes sp.]
MITKEDCIFFEEREKDTALNHCKRSHSLDGNNTLCKHCRLWDSYIPRNSTKEQIEKAVEWQNMPFDKQPDYYEYFNIQ